MVPVCRAVNRSGKARISQKTSNDGVMRRPRTKRGYRKFRNGLLNVEPKGKFVQIVQNNAKTSPLLRLPPELRNKIFELALAGHTVKPDATRSKHSENNRFSLLRSCRQIYAETNVLPYRLSTFSFTYLNSMKRWCDQLSPIQRQSVTAIQFPYRREWAGQEEATNLLCFPSLPQLQVVDVILIGEMGTEIAQSDVREAEKRIEEGIRAENQRLEVKLQ